MYYFPFLISHFPFLFTVRKLYLICQNNEFLQEKSDVAIYIVDALDGKTTVKRLTSQEISDVYEYGIDLFFNTESFLN